MSTKSAGWKKSDMGSRLSWRCAELRCSGRGG
jgi:hypothetical protein